MNENLDEKKNSLKKKNTEEEQNKDQNRYFEWLEKKERSNEGFI